MTKMVSKIGGTLLTLSIFFLPLAQAQFVASLPQCIQDCINQSQDDNCAVTNIGCLCRASAGNFLPDLITCMHGECDNNLDNDLLLTPLQLVCDIAGAPIPESAIRNAEDVASSLATQVTTTQTVTEGGASATGSSGSEATTTVESLSVSVTTATVTTTQGGTTLYLVYPITLESTTTESGPASTVTSISTASASDGFTGVIPVIIVGTDSAGSTYTSTTTEPGAISTYTTTDSAGSTVTQVSTYTATSTATDSGAGTGVVLTTTNSAGSTFTTTQSPSASSASGSAGSSGSSTSDSSTTTFTTSVAADKTSSSGTASSKTSSAANEDETNSSPYKDTNNSATRGGVGNWMGLIVLLAVGIVWV